MMTDSKKPKQLKNPIHYQNNFVPSPEQSNVYKGTVDLDVSIITGDAASGKTMCACWIAHEYLARKEVKRIIITRPIIDNRLGYLPGEIKDKLAPWIYPIKDNFYQLIGKEKTEKLFLDGVIEILPIDFTKGVTYRDTVVIIDEFQDLNYEDFRMCLTRLGKDSKLLFVGSKNQIGIKKDKSCINLIEEKLYNSDNVNFHLLTSNHRNHVIFDIIEELEGK